MEPITRKEMFLAGVAAGEVPQLTPVTRTEMFLAKAAGGDVPALDPVTREEWFINQIRRGGSGGDYVADDFLDETKPVGAVESLSTAIKTNLSERTGITSVSLPNATSVPASFLVNCTGLETLSAPKVNAINGITNTKIVNLFLPSAGYVYNVVGNLLLKTVVIKGISTSNNSNLSGNTALEKVDIIGSGSIAGTVRVQCFNNDTALNVLVLRSSSVVSMNTISAFNGTPFASGGTGGILYVPSALISNYQAATNWSTILGYANNQIKAIEGSTYETKYVDGTSIT